MSGWACMRVPAHSCPVMSRCTGCANLCSQCYSGMSLRQRKRLRLADVARVVRAERAVQSKAEWAVREARRAQPPPRWHTDSSGQSSGDARFDMLGHSVSVSIGGWLTPSELTKFAATCSACAKWIDDFVWHVQLNMFCNRLSLLSPLRCSTSQSCAMLPYASRSL